MRPRTKNSCHCPVSLSRSTSKKRNPSWPRSNVGISLSGTGCRATTMMRRLSCSSLSLLQRWRNDSSSRRHHGRSSQLRDSMTTNSEEEATASSLTGYTLLSGSIVRGAELGQLIAQLLVEIGDDPLGLVTAGWRNVVVARVGDEDLDRQGADRGSNG